MECSGRRPVVAVLDTGCGEHPWLTGVVTRDVELVDGGQKIVIGHERPDPEDSGDITGPMDGLRDPLAGHGTFICGLIHQTCPDADILAVRIIRADGRIAKSDLVLALDQLYELARRHAAGKPDGRPIDVVSLSLGYYNETTMDPAYPSVLLDALDRLAGLGIAIVASAGNDATQREQFPAAFATRSDPARVPLSSVGALNPDGRTVALFSNSGPWVTAWQRGAAVVSTMPVTFQNGMNPPAGTRDPSGRRRTALDPDAFTGGFGIASGTSFAAPLFAGRLASRLLELSRASVLDLDDTGPPAIARRSDAVAELRRDDPYPFVVT